MKKNILFIAITVILGVLSRTVFHLAPNLEFVTALTLAGTFFIKDLKLRFILPLLIMIVSDMIIGNTNIFLFTWSGFMILPVIQMILKKFSKSKNDFLSGLFLTSASGIVGTVVFYLWTNLGVVLLTNMYTNNLTGLMSSYINALPFLRIQLAGNLMLVPMVYTVGYFVMNYKDLRQFNYK